jgi:hypothetical protein
MVRQREAWEAEGLGSTVVERGKAYLAIFACAYGPLSAGQLHELAIRAQIEPELRADDYLAPLRRFVMSVTDIPDDGRRSYVLTHSKFGEFLREDDFDPPSILKARRAFATWARDPLRRLNDGALAPERTPPYLLKYLGQHFEDLANYRAHDATGPHHAAFADMLSLLSEGWVRAWQKVDGSYIGFLADVGRVWTRAEESVRTINSPIKISDATCLQINAPMSAASASSWPLPGRRSPVNLPSAVARRSR